MMALIIDLVLLVFHCFLCHLFVVQTFHSSILVDSLGPECKCVLFQETQGKEFGVFTSPNWPAEYEKSIECLLYTFIAPPEQLIEVTFDEFDVQKTNLDCVYGDFVKLFLHLPDGHSSISESSSWNDVLCGKIADIEQTHYSSSSSLIFEFHSDWRSGNNSGFRGTFRFLSKRLFQTDGHLLPNTLCDYKFESLASSSSFKSPSSSQVSSYGPSPSRSSPSKNTTSINSPSGSGRGLTRGNFFSPQYPSTYPKNIHCSYHFVAQPFERIKLLFEQVILLKSDVSCLKSPDVINIYDGKDSSSQVIGQFCNTNTFVELISTSNYMFVEFWSRSHFPGQGFKASFSFEPIHPSISREFPSDLKHKFHPFSKDGSLIAGFSGSTYSSNCNLNISSDSGKNGTFQSPNYPNPYPPSTTCIYEFNASGKERVQIIFLDFDLKLPADDHSPRDCEGIDTVMVFVVINGKRERIDNFCGSETPLQLMSNGPSLRVEFKSIATSTGTSRGFKALYQFVTHFGIFTGVQDEKRGVCAFVFNSTSTPNGSFSSPNYPGLYPRDTECNYFFFGRPSERVHITFTHFDIEGVAPCTFETASDYVEFSNFKSVDRKIPRHCGLKKPKIIESDGDFFRVTFKSNDRFDGTGFEAQYQFKSPVDAFAGKKMRGVSSTSSSSSSSGISIPRIAWMLTLFNFWSPFHFLSFLPLVLDRLPPVTL